LKTPKAYGFFGSAAPEAVVKLPAPLSKWGQITCTPLGQMLTSREGWIWIMPDASGTVLIPAQELENAKDSNGTDSYFIRIDVAQVKGEEFNSAYGAFHAGFDGKEVTMAGIRVLRVRDGVIVSSRDYGNRR